MNFDPDTPRLSSKVPATFGPVPGCGNAKFVKLRTGSTRRNRSGKI
jgi:hypothetical protein